MANVARGDRPTTREQLTEAAAASFEACSDERLRTIMQAFVRHLHAFASEVELTQEEWTKAIGILTATGHITDERRQEFILWSDTLGLSMLVDALAHPAPAPATESTVLGPFYVPGSQLREYGDDIAGEPAGDPAWVHGRVLDLEGAPIADAELDVWQNGADQLYAVQRPEAPEDHLRGRFRTRADGSFAFLAVRPTPYTIPDDGPGRLDARRDRPPPLAAGAHPRDRPRARLPHRRDPHLRQREPVSRLGRGVRGQAVAPARVRRAVRPAIPPGRKASRATCYAVETDFVLVPDSHAGEPVDPGRTA